MVRVGRSSICGSILTCPYLGVEAVRSRELDLSLSFFAQMTGRDLNLVPDSC
jgi:hypothetical protein